MGGANHALPSRAWRDDLPTPLDLSRRGLFQLKRNVLKTPGGLTHVKDDPALSEISGPHR